MRKSKAHIKLNLDTDVRDNNTIVFKYINSQRKTKDNVGLLLNEVGTAVTEDAAKAELLNDKFVLVFTGKSSL